MINIVFKNISRFVLLIFIQILILNNIELSGFINPYIYVLFIILLPFDIPRWSLLVIGFITGITVDMFSNTLGMHTTATVFMAFCRPFILNMLINKEEIEGG
ncbi:MAG: rod shape-determining protein MreD, partial [Bacteroidota bacterium]|nr:rod shape-determining protein MreD [Bacteroidota bacterium]